MALKIQHAEQGARQPRVGEEALSCFHRVESASMFVCHICSQVLRRPVNECQQGTGRDGTLCGTPH